MKFYSLVYNDARGLVYAWGLTRFADGANVFGIVPTSGESTKVLAQDFSLLGGPMCSDKGGRYLYSNLFGSSDSQSSVIVTLDLNSGTASQVPIDRRLLTMSFQI